MDVRQAPLLYISSQNITSLNTAQALTVPSGARYAKVTAATQKVRYREDGATTAPTAAIGHSVPVDTTILIEGDILSTVRFIEQTASASLFVSYYR